MYESPLSLIIDNMATEIAEAFDKEVLTAFKRCHIDIDKDELIKALAYDRGQYEKGYADGYTSGLAADRWISVEDRLPEPPTQCLVYSSKACRPRGMETATYTEWGWMTAAYFPEITHWMPLPTPPEEVDNDD